MLASFASDHPYRVMPAVPQPARYRPAPSILDLGDRFYDPVEAARFTETRLRFRNDRASASVGLGTRSDAQWIAHFGRVEDLPDNLPAPLALCYHGHQFRNYKPDIGDGHGFPFVTLRTDRG